METSSISFCRSCHNDNSPLSRRVLSLILSGKDDGDLVEMLRNAMTSYSTLLTEHAEMTRAWRAVSHIDAGKDEKAKEAVKTIRLMCTKDRINKVIKTNDVLVNVIHEKGYGRIFDPVVKEE